jgi:hypothetical protein
MTRWSGATGSVQGRFREASLTRDLANIANGSNFGEKNVEVAAQRRNGFRFPHQPNDSHGSVGILSDCLFQR